MSTQQASHLFSTITWQSPTGEAPGLYICPLESLSLIEVKGQDAQRFLQGQLSCDMAQVASEGSRIGAHCSIKGSILSLFRVFRAQDAFQLRLHRQNLEQALNLLKKYIVFSKAQASDLSGQWLGIGIGGPEAQAWLEKHFTDVPTQVDHCTSSDQTTLTRVPGERFELWMTAEYAQVLLAQAEISAAAYCADYWRYQEIINAIAEIEPSMSASFIPQMCNLQVFEGISFKKGCYTGQEVITRLQFRGKLTKYLITASIGKAAVSRPPACGDYLNTKEKEKVGQILQAVEHKDSYYLQAVITKRYDLSELFLDSPESTLTRIALPYTLDPALFERKD